MSKKKIVLLLSALGLVVVSSALFATGALAFGGPTDEERDNRAQELADKLGVDKDRVAKAMDEIRSERQQAREKEVSSQLDKAIQDKVITTDQKQKILDKMAELRNEKGSNRTEMDQWYKDNGIDSDKIHNYIGFGGGMGQGRGRMK